MKRLNAVFFARLVDKPGINVRYVVNGVLMEYNTDIIDLKKAFDEFISKIEKECLI